MTAAPDSPTSTALLVGASRGLGLGLAQEYIARGWQVVATERTASTGLARLAGEAPDRLRIECVDITDRVAITRLRARLSGTSFDLMVMVAGINGNVWAPLHRTTPEEAARVYLTNAYFPIACAEELAGLVGPGGVVAFMSSILGSIASNADGTRDAYRTSKAALNMAARSFQIRHQARIATVLSIAPGWVKTDMGGPDAPLDVATSARRIADLIAAWRGQPGHHYLNHDGARLPW